MRASLPDIDALSIMMQRERTWSLDPRPIASEGKCLVQRALGQFREEQANAGGHNFGQLFPLGGRGSPGIARARVGGQEMPRPGDLDPAAIDRLEAARP